MSLPTHGANPQYVYEAYGMDMPEEIMDFSANLNPFGPPASLEEKWSGLFTAIAHYPDPHATQLTKQLSLKNGVSESSILVGNGGAELITLVGRLLTKKEVLIIQPAFAEYAEACLAAQCDISYFSLEEPDWELKIDEIKPHLAGKAAVFLCTPNNPTGVAFSRESVKELIAVCKQQNCFVIIDEAFYDFTEDAYTYTAFLEEHMIILRSLTKMFSIPGLRLGYAIANEQVIAKLKTFKPHWSVNALAMEAGKLCILEEEYRSRTRKYIREQRERLFAFFREYEFEVSNSSINFYLLRDKAPTEALYVFLLKKGLVPRHTYNFPGLDGKWLRFAIKSEVENEMLMEALRQWRKQSSIS